MTLSDKNPNAPQQTIIPQQNNAHLTQNNPHISNSHPPSNNESQQQFCSLYGHNSLHPPLEDITYSVHSPQLQRAEDVYDNSSVQSNSEDGSSQDEEMFQTEYGDELSFLIERSCQMQDTVPNFMPYIY